MDIFGSRAERLKQYKLQSLAPKIVKSYPALHGYLNKEVAPTRKALQQVFQRTDINPALKKSVAKKRRKSRRRRKRKRMRKRTIKRQRHRTRTGKRKSKRKIKRTR